MSDAIADDEYRMELTRAIMQLLDSWGLSLKQAHGLLNIDGVASRHFSRYGDSLAFPDDEDLNKRIEHLVGIAEALRTAYPRNPYMVTKWMTKPNSKFNNRPPLFCALEEGTDGLAYVRAHLDCTFAWDQNSQTGK